MRPLLICLALAAAPAAAQDFRFEPVGALLPGSGRGAPDPTVFAPAIRFPIDHTPSYANSQVWMTGGSSGPPGSWKNPVNFRYPWRDNFCEARARRTSSCPSGRGHQGQDIRVGAGENDRFWAVAAEDGRISTVGIYLVELTGVSGTRYRYLHLSMDKLKVRQGQAVKAGDRLGMVSNDFGGNITTVHLHFELLQNVNGSGLRHVSPYMSLVRAYQRRIGAP